jgi:dihydroorotate dehydrogenase (NAD+) catalytic subunit
MRAGALRPAPIVGIGGVLTGLDALQLVLAGACAVQVGTSTFHDPSAPARVARELAQALAERGISRFADVVGLGHEQDPVAALAARRAGTEHLS